MATKFTCVACRKQVTATKNDRYRTHTDADGNPCELSSTEIPEHVLEVPVVIGAPADVPVEGVDYAVCPESECGRKVKLTRLGYFEPHDTTLRGGQRCQRSGTRLNYLKKLEDLPLPGDEVPAKGVQQAQRPAVHDSERPVANRGLAVTAGPAPVTEATSAPPGSKVIEGVKVVPLTHPDLASGPDEDEMWKDHMASSVLPAPDAGSSASTETSSPESGTTSTPLPESTEVSGSSSSDSGPLPFQLGSTIDPRFLQPFSPFSQPGKWEEPKPVFLQPAEYNGPVKPEPMGDLAKELSTKIRETFYSYSNRKSSDNRSAQTTLGPSEIGTPCDRRLAMALMNIPPVNPGGDGWAAFVGTCTHVGMAEIYTFADAGTGRYAVEMPVFLGVPTVPRGTTDLLDRSDGTVVDWKVMGKYSLDKFRREGPSVTYRTQAHVYGLGAERGGEKVRNVAIVGLPRAGSSLDEMHVWTEKYDRKFAQDALARVERIANDIQAKRGATADTPADIMLLAKAFPAGDDCRYCPFHLKGDTGMQKGCPGKV